MTHIHCKSLKWLFLCLLVLLPCMANADASITMTTSPTNILMDARFDGTTLKVEGTVPADSDVILRFTGAPEELHLRQKGKVFGLLWMNTGKVILKNVPKICLIETSVPFDKLGAAARPFQLESLKSTIEVEEESNSSDIDVIHELLLLKKHEKLYNEVTQGIQLGPNTGETRTFSADLPIPSALAPSHYTIEAVAVRNGAVAGKQTAEIEAKLIGFPAWLSKLAFHNGLLYGVLATIIAVVSGLGIGLMFQSKGAH